MASDYMDKLPGISRHPTGSAEIGSQDWWSGIEEAGTPVCVEHPDAPESVTLHFLWRDPHGLAAQSPIVAVYLDINCVTDHHSFSPQSLNRVVNTDVWHWQCRLDADWRGSYCYLAITRDQLPPSPDADPLRRQAQQRAWWRSLLPHKRADPLNLAGPKLGSWREQLSAIHLKAAPAQTAWQALDNGPASQGLAKLAQGKRQLFTWHSAILGTERPVWLYEPQGGIDAQAPQQRPLVLLLDGEVWAQSMPIFSALDHETRQGLPAAVYVLIDSLGPQNRARELPCHAPFWLAVQQELMPQIHRLAPHSRLPQKTLLVGQSYGGLSALFAGLHWPQRFGCVLSQSGSFWWPHAAALSHPAASPTAAGNIPRRGWLTEQLAERRLPESRIRIFMEAGSRETAIRSANQELYHTLKQAGHEVTYRVYKGGHDKLCWRGGLLQGLRHFLAQDVF
ncbi:enterochelin esterase [Shewanella salipaludis]|uniref:Enterochelin esterase n=1 Tax=Shewanella salipaludis TaxID=2723052 RepID=A0A972JJF7_9GAMM|nr:enterochelin esterase [Shewanella salipaludis]NMH63999.1 enterochelin esterase [Shewanella salipaludis]